MQKPLKLYGIKIKDKDKLLKSQSGGAFLAIAEYLINEKNAIVYGCGMDEKLQATYMRIDTINDLHKLNGSKYVQAQLRNTIKSVINDLKNGHVVLFSGTPCYVEAINLMTKKLKQFENLYTVDIVCHGVPSPKVYNSYLKYLSDKEKSEIVSYIFRDKKFGGWKKSFDSIEYSNGKIEHFDSYAQLFYTNLPLRPSCGECRFASMTRAGDFTIGDYWGIERVFPDFFDNNGVSLLFLNTEKSIIAFNEFKNKIDVIETSVDKVALQPNLKGSTYIPKTSNQFWKDFNNKGIKYCFKHWSTTGGYPFKIKRKILKILKLW